MTKAPQPLEIGDQVIWWKRVPGGDYVFPVSAKVLAVTATCRRKVCSGETESSMLEEIFPSPPARLPLGEGSNPLLPMGEGKGMRA